MAQEQKLDPYKKIKEILSGTKTAFLWVFFFSFWINLFQLALPLYMLQIYQRVLTSRSLQTMVYLTIIALICLAVFAFLSTLRSRILFDVARWIDRRISEIAFDLIPDKNLEGDNYSNVVMQDVGAIRQFIIGPNLSVLFDTPWSIIFFVILFLLHPWFGYFSVTLSLLLFGLAFLNERLTKNDIRNSVEKSRETASLLTSILRNVDTVQGMGMEQRLKDKWMHENMEAADLAMRSGNQSTHILAYIKFIRLAGQVLILAMGAYLVIENEITAGAMIAASIIVARALAPVEQIVSAWLQFAGSKDALKRLNAFIEKPPSRKKGFALTSPQGHLSIENLYFAFPASNKFTIKQLNLKVAAGTMVAIIGPSAAGKTTLGRLLLGILKPTQGLVRLDGADLYNCDRSHVGLHLGFLPQDIELFPGTISENIARMKKADQKLIVEAAQCAGAHEMILGLPSGYETQISQQGTGLSLGQMQRVALARALYQDPKLLVLDEPNSNLDREGEKSLFDALAKIKEKKSTAFIISHRMDILRYVDKILLLVNGELQLFGDRDEVMAKLMKTQK